MTIDQHQPFSPSRRALLGLAGLAGIAAPFGVMGAARAFPALGLGPAADPLSAAPICRVANSDEAPKGPARHIRFAYNGTGICTAAVPVALHTLCFLAQLSARLAAPYFHVRRRSFPVAPLSSPLLSFSGAFSDRGRYRAVDPVETRQPRRCS